MNIQQTLKETGQTRRTTRTSKILRFRRSERMVHWAIAVPFMVCFATALILVVFYNPDPLRPYRSIFSWTHRISGAALFIFPLLAIIRSRGDYRTYFHNIKQAWLWSMEDLKWLVLMGLAALSRRFKLPEQGKFNAAEKINFMMLMSTYPLYILTGLFIWLTDGALLSWLVHFAMAIAATPLLVGHLYMAMVNPGTRKGLSGMISGFVDSQWAKHHYGRWYRENFENDEGIPGVPAKIYGPKNEGPVPVVFANARSMETAGKETADADDGVLVFAMASQSMQYRMHGVIIERDTVLPEGKTKMISDEEDLIRTGEGTMADFPR